MHKECPALVSSDIIKATLHDGSHKDGISDEWRYKPALYHLVKGMSHLAMHIKQCYDPRNNGTENHLHKAISRLAMACVVERSRL